jgi:hypothetical protein
VKSQRDIGTRLQDRDSFVGIHCLDRRKAGVLHHVDGAHSQQHLVLYDENDSGHMGMIENHHDWHFK